MKEANTLARTKVNAVAAGDRHSSSFAQPIPLPTQ
jgi:hypothetical protein